MAGNRPVVPRFEWLMTKTYVQDAHKPWTGQIQGETFYVGSPGFEFEHGPVKIAFNAPEELRLRPLITPEAFLPGRPLGVSPHAPYRHPYGTETRGVPFFDYGYDYLPEEYMDVPGLEPRPVGMNELPVYFGAGERQFYGQVWSRGVKSIPKMVPRPNVPFWGQPVDEYQHFIGQPSRKAYGVTKVVDNIVQQNPEQPYPGASEDMAYDPDGAGTVPYGLSVPTISKSAATFTRKPAYYGARDCGYMKCGGPVKPCWSKRLKRCSW